MKLPPLPPVRAVPGLVASHGLFWSWNLLFLTFVGFGLPDLLVELALAGWRGEIPMDFVISAYALLAIPVASMVGGIVLRRHPWKLFQLFYGVQAPLFFLCLVRLFLVRELTPGMLQLLTVLGVAIGALGIELFRGIAQDPRRLGLQLGAHAVMLCAGVYTGLILGFHAVPAAFGLAHTVLELFESLLSASWWDFGDELYRMPLFMALFALWVTMFLYTASLFVFMPIAVTGIYARSFLRVFRAFRDRVGFPAAWAVSAAGLATVVGTFVAANEQTQQEVFARLEAPPVDDDARRALLAEAAPIRDGLVNAYLAPYRYWSGEPEAHHVYDMWTYVCETCDSLPGNLQVAFHALAKPVLYDGSMHADRIEAEAAYEQFFDVPLQRAEREAVLHAIGATWDRGAAEAGLLDVGEQRVHLERQELLVSTKRDLAEVQIDETYRNQTHESQEVLYYFSLPESAAITGLWLSDDGDDRTRFQFAVAPRGAAQQVYREQVTLRRDPALIEQVGPRQYRLRAFPVPARPFDGTPAPLLHLRLTYTVPVGPGGVALPHLLERRNIYWDDATVRSATSTPDLLWGADGDRWVPYVLPQAAPAEEHRIDLDNGFVVRAVPVSTGPKVLPSGRRYAVVVDRSRSMAERAGDVEEAYAWLLESVHPHDDLDVYLTAGRNAGEPVRLDDPAAFHPAEALWYGSLQPREMLEQFARLARDTRYDAVLVLTDAGSYDLVTPDVTPVAAPSAPLWMLHLGGALPPAYDDAMLEAIQGSGGGVATTVEEVFARLSLWEIQGLSSNVADGYVWTVEPSAGGTSLPSGDATSGELPVGDPFLPLAARQFVLARARSADMSQNEELDRVHAVAKGAAVVTAYSSMIVLVDEAQRQRLAELETAEDRFTRESEGGKEAITSPLNPLGDLSGAPEPEEWALLGLVAAMLIAVAWRRRYESGPVPA
jgi:putative PEP-CTERM system integral membrane protein